MSSRQTSQRQQPISDTKAKQDVAGSKSGKSSGGFSRGGKRREPQNSSFPAANPRRPPPKVGRGGGWKQPLSRGYPPAYGGYSVTEEDEGEVGSLFNYGSKKQSLNHLLNFQYTPKGRPETNPGSRSRSRGGGGWGGGGGRNQKQAFRQTFSKEEYLQANCQFIVDSRGDYAVHEVDPDIPVHWELIQQVHLRTAGTDPMSCPICLFPPVAGKISRCGHVFCWPCILHYLALSDDTSRKCPICYDDIQKTDLKSVQIFQQESHVTGGSIEMRLMKRERNSLFAVPVSHPGLATHPSLQDTKDNQALGKIIKATPEEVVKTILGREQQELEQQYREEKQQPEAVFIQEALNLLQDRMLQCGEALSLSYEVGRTGPVGANFTPMQAVGANLTPLKPNPIPPLEEIKVLNTVSNPDPFQDLDNVLNNLDSLKITEAPISMDVCAPVDKESERPRHSSSSSSDGEEGDETTITAADLDISSFQLINQENGLNKNTPKSTFYFYQDAKGQLIFLHALNIQMLMQEYGSFENCPHTISARILEKDSSTMTSELRDRLRYLRHLPVSSSFDVAELDLSNLVSKNTFQVFKDQLETRKKKRQRKLKAEKVREKRIRLEENRIMGRYPSPMARIDSAYHYPKMGDELDFLSPSPQLASSLDSQSSGFDLMGVESSAQQGEGRGGLNFARITKTGGGGGGVPKVQRTAAPVNTMVQLGGQMLARRRLPCSDSEPEIEGYMPPPPAVSLGASLGDALAQALAQADKQTNKKKGKKGRGILLTGGSQRPIK